MATLSEGIISILHTAEKGHHNETKLVKELGKLEESNSAEDFFSAFLEPLKRILVVAKKEPSVERCLKLIAHFTASGLVRDSKEESQHSHEEDFDSVYFLLLKQLITYHETKNKAVRTHVCQLFGMVLELALDMHEEITLPDDLSDAIQESMLKRLYDKTPAVRVQAVHALRRFQDAQDLECSVIAEFIHLLRKDTVAEVRKAVLNCIELNKKTLPAVIERTRDVNASIRQLSYMKLAENCTIRHLTISQRVQLLHDGLQDRSDDVQKACICNLLRSWSQTLGDDFLRLLQCCDVEASPQVAELALMKLFEHIDNNSLVESMEAYMSLVPEEQESDKENVSNIDNTTRSNMCLSISHTVPIQFLSSEVSFYWRCLCKYLRSLGQGGEQLIERLLPSISEYCEYLIRFHAEMLSAMISTPEQVQVVFIAEQLFNILLYMDYSDEVGRRSLATTTVRLMTSSKFPASLIGALMRSQANIWPQPSVRVERILEIVAEIGHPLEGTLLASLTLSGEPCEVSHSVESSSDPGTVLKCLALTSELLRELRMPKLPPSLQMLCETLILPSLQNEDPLVRDSALNALALMCILDRDLALKHFYLLLQVSRIDHEGVQATALKAVFDLLLLHGFDSFKSGGDMNVTKQDAELSVVSEETTLQSNHGDNTSCDNDSKGEDNDGDFECSVGLEALQDDQVGDETTQKVIDILSTFLDTESSLLRCTAGEGLAKLLLSGRIISRRILAKLLLLWYNPLIQDEDRLRSVLGIFFQVFSSRSRGNKETLCEVFVPVVRTIIHAPPSSPLSTVDANNVVDFLVQLTSQKDVQGDAMSGGLHCSLAVQVANEALKDILDPSVRIYCRALNLLDIDASDEETLVPLEVLADELLDNVADRISKRYVDKFKEALTSARGTNTPSPFDLSPRELANLSPKESGVTGSD